MLLKLLVNKINLKKAYSEEKVALQREIQIQKKLQHPNIIRLYSAEEKDNKLYIILEYMSRGTLFNYLMEQKDGFSENQALDYFKQMLKAMNYLHQNKILHRDLKPENILMGESGQIKLCDFGFTAIFGDQIRVTKCGTREYMAPEMFQNRQQDDGVDIWSLGILLFELTHKSTPFPLNILFDFQRHHKRFKIPFKQNLSPEVKNLISKILQYNPKKRPTANQILDLPLLKNIKEENHDQDDENYKQTNTLKAQQQQLQNQQKINVVQKTYSSSKQVTPLMNQASKFQDFYQKIPNHTPQKNITSYKNLKNDKPLFNIQKYQNNYQNFQKNNFDEYGVKKPTQSNSRVITSSKSYQRNYTPVQTYKTNNFQKSTSIQQKFNYGENSGNSKPLYQNTTYQSHPIIKTNFSNSHSGKFYNFNQQKYPLQQTNSNTNINSYFQNIYQDKNNNVNNHKNIYTQSQKPVLNINKFSNRRFIQEEQPILYEKNIYQQQTSQRITNNQIDQPNRQVNFQIPFHNSNSTQNNYIKAIKRSYQPTGYSNGGHNTSDFPTYNNIVTHKSQYGGIQTQNGFIQNNINHNYQNDQSNRNNGFRQHSQNKQKIKKISLNDYH